jgi:hypothetical protein
MAKNASFRLIVIKILGNIVRMRAVQITKPLTLQFVITLFNSNSAYNQSPDYCSSLNLQPEPRERPFSSPLHAVRMWAFSVHYMYTRSRISGLHRLRSIPVNVPWLLPEYSQRRVAVPLCRLKTKRRSVS